MFAEDAREAGYDAEMGRAFPWALFRKPCPGLGPQNGLQFPQRGSSGKYIPEFGARAGRSFPMGAVSEVVSRNQPSERDAVSARQL